MDTKTIGIDARLIRETGVGRYIRNIISGLAKLDKTNRYIVYLTSEGMKTFVPPNDRWSVRIADVHWHTLSEQFVMPRLFAEDRLDLVHIPYVTIPVFYSGKMVVTMHDLTILKTETGKASTLPWPLYRLKRLALAAILDLGLRRAVRVIAVSEATRRDLEKTYPFVRGKTEVVYEGVDADVRDPVGAETGRESSPPYFLCVGNAYPHKNLEMLLHAFVRFAAEYPGDAHELHFVGRPDFFYGRLERLAGSLPVSAKVRFFHGVSDVELAKKYRGASALLFPSKMEGFGLPAIEAAAMGTPVIVSDIPVFREILGTIPEYVSVSDPDAWSAAMHGAAGLARTPHPELLEKYDWKKASEKTLRMYEDCIRL